MSSPDVSEAIEEALRRSLIVIPSINGARLLDRMLPTLRVPRGVVVVMDQGSSDDTAHVCERYDVEIFQLGSARTYTEACNAGIELAKSRGREYVFFSNNDIVLTTDVTRELLGEMTSDSNLGIVAPSQLIVNSDTGERRLSYRVSWDLRRLKFTHDYAPPTFGSKRIESDFCELTFAVARVAVLEHVGGLDNDYGFYHEDADLGFRLRDAGYACAYLPASQIEHYAGSSFGSHGERRAAYLRESKATFARKHLGYGVKYPRPEGGAEPFRDALNGYLHGYLSRYGLLDKSRPELHFSAPETYSSGYLYTSWEPTRGPAGWRSSSKSYDLVLGTSERVTKALKDNGFPDAKCVPPGIETDVFHPWGPSLRLSEARTGGRTFLWMGRNQPREGLDVLIQSWTTFHERHPASTLIVVGTGILSTVHEGTANTWRSHNCIIRALPSAGITLYETVAPFDAETIAAIYRGADFTICISPNEGFGFVVAESLACGVPAIFADFGATAQFAFPGSLTIDVSLRHADYSDISSSEVGDRWEPSAESLLERLLQAQEMSSETYAGMSAMGVRLVRSKFSWRTTVMTIRRALSEVQSKSEVTPREPAALPRSPTGRKVDREVVGSGPRLPWTANRAGAKGARRISNSLSQFAAILETRGGKATATHIWNRIWSLVSSRLTMRKRP